MKLQDITGQRVKISAATLTVKDENGKTRGLVRGVRSFKAWSNRDRNDNFRSLVTSGLWDGASKHLIDLDRVILDGAKMYFLRDLRKEENYNKYFAGREDFQQEHVHHEKYMEILEACEKAGITVIPCYVA